MTLERAAKDYKAYLALLKIFGIPYPVPDEHREALDARIAHAYESIQAKTSRLPARCRRVVVRIIEESKGVTE